MALVSGRKTQLGPLLIAVTVFVVGVALFRSLVFDLYWIPSGSMEPAVQAREVILVSKHSFLKNQLPLQRGQVVVFRSVVNPKIAMLKRVVAVGGDTVRIDPVEGLVLNGEPLTSQGAGIYYETWLGESVRVQWQPPFQAWELSVPEGHFVALGDNRSDSVDSRVWGAVPEANLLGRALRVVWSCQGPGRGAGCAPAHLRAGRLGYSLSGEQ